MSTDVEKLVVQLEASLKQYEREMARARGVTTTALRKIEKDALASTAKVEKQFATMGLRIRQGFASNLGGGVVAGLFTAATVSNIQQAIKSVADLADEADRVGLSVEDFQALAFAANFVGVEAGKVTDLFQKFNIEIGEAAIKGNDLAKILAANNVPLKDANGKLRDQKALFYDMADLIRNARNQQEAAVLAMAAFGKGAADALPLLQGGSEAIKEGEQRARDLGAVISEDLVKKAGEFDDRWEETWLAWSAQGKAAIIGIMATASDSGLQDLLQSMLASGSAFQRKLQDGRNPFDRQFFMGGGDPGNPAEVEAALVDATRKRRDLEQQIAELRAAGRPPIELDEFNDRLDAAKAKVAELQAQLDALRNPARNILIDEGGTGRREPVSVSSAASTVIPADLGGGGAGGNKRTGSRSALAHTARDARDAIGEVIEALHREREALLEGDLQREVSNRLREAGVTAASREGQQITALVKANDALKRSQEAAVAAGEEYFARQAELKDSMMELGRMGFDAFERIAFSGEKASDVILDLAKSFADAAMQAAFFGSGPMAGLFGGSGSGSGGIFGSLFGSLLGGLGGGASGFAGFYANGGLIPAGKVGIAGEAGMPELIEGPARVTPINRLTGGGDTRVTIAVNLSGANGDAAVARIARQATIDGLREYERQRPLVDTERALRAG